MLVSLQAKCFEVPFLLCLVWVLGEISPKHRMQIRQNLGMRAATTCVDRNFRLRADEYQNSSTSELPCARMTGQRPVIRFRNSTVHDAKVSS